LFPHLSSGLSGGLGLRGHGSLELNWQSDVLSGMDICDKKFVFIKVAGDHEKTLPFIPFSLYFEL
jgi:hypothetical protein